MGRRDSSEGNRGISALTASERRILSMIAGGSTSPEIAATLVISVRTVEHHRANMSRKLDLRGSNALVKFAIAHRSELS